MEPDDFDAEMSRSELIEFLGDFMSQSANPDMLYRDHLCSLVVAKIFTDFGHEGLCALMMEIDRKANWISDIIFEQADFDNALFSLHGTYDNRIVDKARNSESIIELNKKIWRLRKKYARSIVNEIMVEEEDDETPEASE